jgi:hypothetical protein
MEQLGLIPLDTLPSKIKYGPENPNFLAERGK